MHRYALIILLFLALSACGGGGTSSGVAIPPPTPPPTQPPEDNTKWQVTAPNYKGSTQAYNISKTNAGETFYSVLQAIDSVRAY
ncbi:MAG: hypothetical protein ACJAQS_001808 [Porticoccus sp.]|jgi:hypothetical protein